MKIAYEADVVAWAHEQAALMRAGRLSALDIEHLAEEIETIGASQRRELKNRLAVLLQHLLMWSHQPALRSRSWEATMLAQRTALADILSDSPSLRSALHGCFASAYPLAVRYAAKETALPERSFPRACPYGLGDTLTEDWLPPADMAKSIWPGQQLSIKR
jgi:Domain of unknown function DUF29